MCVCVAKEINNNYEDRSMKGNVEGVNNTKTDRVEKRNWESMCM